MDKMEKTRGNINRSCPFWKGILLVMISIMAIRITYNQNNLINQQNDIIVSSLEPFLVEKAHPRNPYNSTLDFGFKNLRVEDAFANKLRFLHEVKAQVPPSTRTRFEENINYVDYGLISATGVCMYSNGGPLLLVGMKEEELKEIVSRSRSLQSRFDISYNCSSGCSGYKLVEKPPEDAIWIEGNSTHIRPYLGNVMHNFGDRVWPHIAGFQYPLNTTTPKPISHFVVDNLMLRIKQSEDTIDRNTLLFQIRVLAELSPGSDFIVSKLGDPQLPMCFERLTLDCERCDRMAEMLDYEIYAPAFLRYRKATFSFLGFEEEPKISIPPYPLRVAFYGRSDTRRRKGINGGEVVKHLREWRHPKLEVIHVDEMLMTQKYNQTFPETVHLLRSTDIFISVHGANTWSMLFLPIGACVVEIYGPCGPGTWISTIAKTLNLKHDKSSNPWKERVASPSAGNTTECLGPYQTPDFTLDLERLDFSLFNFALPSGPGDRIPLHWLFNWTSNSYL